MRIHYILSLFPIEYKDENHLHETDLPRKAVGEMIPVLFATMIAMPDSRKGTVKSTTDSRSALIFSADKTMSVFFVTSSFISPFHFPFWGKDIVML